MTAKKASNRLDKIYTRSGDSGKTNLALGKRLYKCDVHIKTLGEVDELNCHIGIIIATLDRDNALCTFLQRIQNTLFDIGGELAMNSSDFPSLEQYFIDELEQQMDTLNQQLPPLKEFILPGGHMSAAQCHLARAVCRRVERQLVELSIDSDRFAQAKKYINRLSDFLFVAARFLNKQHSNSELSWVASVKPDNK